MKSRFFSDVSHFSLRLCVSVLEAPSPAISSQLEGGVRKGQTFDSRTVVSQSAQPKKQRHAEFKGLTDYVSGERRTGFSGFARRLEHGKVNLLILNWLLVKCR